MTYLHKFEWKLRKTFYRIICPSWTAFLDALWAQWKAIGWLSLIPTWWGLRGCMAEDVSHSNSKQKINSHQLNSLFSPLFKFCGVLISGPRKFHYSHLAYPHPKKITRPFPKFQENIDFNLPVHSYISHPIFQQMYFASPQNVHSCDIHRGIFDSLVWAGQCQLATYRMNYITSGSRV